MKALGRLVNSACILTMRRRQGNARFESAIASSWVSQAGFTPPAVSIAVPRQEYGPMPSQPGDRFVVNVLAGGRENGR
jgi:flavin reductase (DIM6/NTAB) family NADH-FMN oxidoreductase RutF